MRVVGWRSARALVADGSPYSSSRERTAIGAIWIIRKPGDYVHRALMHRLDSGTIVAREMNGGPVHEPMQGAFVSAFKQLCSVRKSDTFRAVSSPSRVAVCHAAHALADRAARSRLGP